MSCFAQLSMVADELWVVTPGKSKAPFPKRLRGFNLKPCCQDVPGRVTVFEGSLRGPKLSVRLVLLTIVNCERSTGKCFAMISFRKISQVAAASSEHREAEMIDKRASKFRSITPKARVRPAVFGMPPSQIWTWCRSSLHRRRAQSTSLPQHAPNRRPGSDPTVVGNFSRGLVMGTT